MKLLKPIFFIFILICLVVFLVGCPLENKENSQSQNQEEIQQLQRIYFDYPVRDEPIGKTENGQLYWDCCSDNDFCDIYNGKFHSGEDWNLKGSRNDIDEGKLVYSIGEGKVICAKEESVGFRVVIEHTGTCIIPSKENIKGSSLSYKQEIVDKIYSVYLHLKDLQVKVGDEVEIDDVIGKIKKYDPEVPPHLHFEIRKEWNNVYESYFENIQQIIDLGFRDPSEFIEANMIESQVVKGSSQTIPEESFSIEIDTAEENEITQNVTDHPWPMLYHDTKFSKQCPYPGPENPEEKWSFSLNGFISDLVVDRDGIIYFISNANNEISLFAMDANGEIKWKHKIESSYLNTSSNYYNLALNNKGNIIIAYSKGLMSVDSNNNLSWDIDLGDCRCNFPIINKNNDIFIITVPDSDIAYKYGDDILYCISESGELNWEVDLKKYYDYDVFPAKDPDIIINESGKISIGNGFTEIQIEGYIPSFDEPHFLSYTDSLISKNNIVYFPYWESNHICAIQFPTYDVVWDFITDGSVCSPAIDKNNNLYIPSYDIYGDADSFIYSFNSKNNLNWSIQLAKEIFPVITIDSNGTIYASCQSNNTIYAISSSGEIQWKYKFSSDMMINSPIIVGTNRMIFITFFKYDDNNNLISKIIALEDKK